MAIAVSTSHAPLASTRSATPGPTASRTAPTSATPASVAHLHLHRGKAADVLHEERAVDERVHRHPVAHRGAGNPTVAASSAARRHTAGSLGYPGSGDHSPHPAGPSRRVTGRSPIAKRVLGQDRHSPTLTSTATTTSTFDVATSAATRHGGSERVSIVRTGATASGSASSPSSAHGCEIPITTTATNDPT